VTADEIIDEIIRREGGFVDHRADRGGPTKYGITQATLAAWRGHPVSADDVRILTVDEARAIYRARYIRDPGFDRIADPQLRALLVDCAVLQGPSRAVVWLQRACGVTADGKFGPLTERVANELAPRLLRARITASRARALGRLITDDPKQAAFAAGWMNRVAEFIEGLA
jgi:lysozyme family protein